MYFLQQVVVPVGIDITAYDCGRSCQVWLDPIGEGVALFKDLNYFQTGTQMFPRLDIWQKTID